MVMDVNLTHCGDHFTIIYKYWIINAEYLKLMSTISQLNKETKIIPFAWYSHRSNKNTNNDKNKG